MPSALDNLVGPGKALTKEAPDKQEFDGLVRSGSARLKDAQLTGLSLEGRFDLSYNAAHALCLAALRWHGFRPSHRYIVFQSLPHTLQLGPEVWRILDKCHKARNVAEYEGQLRVSERLVKDLIAACKNVEEAVNKLASLDDSQ